MPHSSGSGARSGAAELVTSTSDRRCGRFTAAVASAAILLSGVGCATPSPTVAPAARTAQSVQIPSIGLRTGALIDLGLTSTQELEVPGDAVTAGWFELSPDPGEVGPAVIAGHVDYDSVPGVFVRLREVRPGDEISVDRADGSTAVFTAYEVDRYPKSQFPTERCTATRDRRNCGSSPAVGASTSRPGTTATTWSSTPG